MKGKKIIFRTDAGADIGYGHFIRSLALADMLKNSFDCLFVTQTPTDYQKKELSNVCAYRELPADSRKFDLFLDMLTGEEIVVLDNYFFDTSYQQTIKNKGCSLVCIDDMHDKHYVADVLINHGLTDPSLFSVEPYTRLCLGLNWALLRKPFLEPIFCERESGHVAVAFGGSDPYNLTLKAAEILARREDIDLITAVIGDAYTNSDHIASIDKVSVLKNQTAEQMADLFRRVTFAVLSSSTVAIEALACGCPVYAGYYIGNQWEYFRSFAQHGRITPLGNLLEQDFSLLLNMRRPVIPPKQEIFDVAKRYTELFRGLSLRVVDYVSMTEDESKQVWNVRNLESIRQYMTNSEPFDFDSHERFVNSLSTSNAKRYWAVFDRDVLVGSFNVVNINGQIAERGLFVTPAFMGKQHMARVMEERMYPILKNDIGLTCLTALVLKTNLRSCKFHEKMGYIVDRDDDNYYYFSKNL